MVEHGEDEPRVGEKELRGAERGACLHWRDGRGHRGEPHRPIRVIPSGRRAHPLIRCRLVRQRSANGLAGSRTSRRRTYDVFSAAAARMSAFSASSSISSPSWMSMARLVLPSRLELKRPEGSFSEAPLAKVIFTTFL